MPESDYSAARARQPVRFASLLCVLWSSAVGCSLPPERESPHVGSRARSLEAECTALLDNASPLDVETDYVPQVLACENNESSYEGHKALAVAIRSLLYYQLEQYGYISSAPQVYYCGREPNETHLQAAADTSGEVLRYAYSGGSEVQIYGFHVAGNFQEPPSCQGGGGSGKAEWAVTYNEGKSGDNVTKTGLGGNVPANRGAMSQNGSDCLGQAGRHYHDILRFYYGADIGIVRAEGDCVTGEDEPDAAPPPDDDDVVERPDGGAPLAEADAGTGAGAMDPMLGGCSAAGGGSSRGIGLLPLLLVAAIRRRRR